MERSKVAKFHNNLLEAHLESAWSSDERKLFIEIISRIGVDEEIEKDRSYYMRLSISSLFSELDKANRYNYNQVVEVAYRLKNKLIGYIDDEGFTFKSIFSEISHKKGSGYIEVWISDRAIPFLLELSKNFTKIPKKEVIKLASGYSIRLYELLKRFEDTGIRKDKIDDLKKKLGIKSGYKRLIDFERFVLKKAIEEINEKTDINVEYKKIKEGKKVKYIIFFINKKEKAQQIDKIDPEEEKLNVLKEYEKKYKKYLNNLNLKRINKKQALFFFINADKSVYNEIVISELIKNADKNKTIKNPIGFLINLLNIDMDRAVLKELTFLDQNFDEKLFIEKVKKEFNSNSQANKEALEIIKPALKNLNLTDTDKKYLIPALNKAVYIKSENKIFIPAPNKTYKYFLLDFTPSLSKLTNVDFDVILLE